MKNFSFIFLVGFGVTLAIMPIVIKMMKKLKGGQQILEFVENHKVKQGTPTMGGLGFLLGLSICFFCIFDNNSRLASILLLVTIAYGMLGFLDDYLKIKLKHNEGLRPYQKAVGQLGIAIIVAVFVYRSGMVDNSIILPFSNSSIYLGWWIIPFIVFFYVAVTNSVNLTDGLDGLAGGVSTVFLIAFLIISGSFITSSENLVVNAELNNIVLMSVALAGCLMAFLWFNWHPAKVFMGDTGSLAIGGFIATILTFTRLYLLMFTIGIMFVVNTLSVVLQVGYYKLTKKRIFRMAPLHHHFERSGVYETKIVFWYIAVTVVAFALTKLFI